jgi:hypothetical protein
MENQKSRDPAQNNAFGMYMPPLLEALGLAEVEHNPKTTG